ncbi:PREDICTED: ras-associated and pleckstrin homology domains-containing protein 1-like, partial [Crocodylus porosus]|uniref:ras-associated and pleckstrin homology domains-containing protein 1-like n=1 Tax=Crocodylus porosus TaxID=8502 RepID=UPI00093BA711
KQQSFSVKPPPSPQSPVPSVVKQIASQFPPPPTPPASDPPPLKPLPLSVAPQSPPAVKAKPKWQPASAPSPDFPPPPPESSLVFPPPPPPATSAASPTPSKTGSPVKKTSKTSSPGGKKPPPTPQRNSSIKSASSAEYHESKRPSVDSLVSKFAHPPEPSGSPSKESLPPPAAPPKPGKLNLSGVNLPIVLQQGGLTAKAVSGVGVSGKDPVVEFPSPPSDSDFPPPPPEIDLPFPPVEIPAVFSGSTSPKVAVVNPQPQPWSKSSVKKAPPPTRPKRNDSTRLTQADIGEPQVIASPQVPTSPKSGLSVQPGFLADLNRTLQRKSITRHGSLSSSRISRTEPTATMDDMVLPPPPPELLADQQKPSHYGGSHISGYATLRRGPPPAPPKRDQNTKLSRDW